MEAVRWCASVRCAATGMRAALAAAAAHVVNATALPKIHNNHEPNALQRMSTVALGASAAAAMAYAIALQPLRKHYMRALATALHSTQT